MTSQVRQNFHKDCEDGINKQINLELYASYVYLSLVWSRVGFNNLKNLTRGLERHEKSQELTSSRIKFEMFGKQNIVNALDSAHRTEIQHYNEKAYHFQRDDVALLGFYKYFKEASEEEREHAYKLLEYQNKRGGRVVLTNIEAPEKQEWHNAAEAMNAALDLEKRVNESLLNLHSVASGHMDVNLCDFLDTHYMQEQVDAIKEIGDHVTNLKRVGEGLGVFMFDQRLNE